MTGKYLKHDERMQFDNHVDDKKRLLPFEDDAKNLLSIRICKTFQLAIYKPFIPLKLSLFLWFGAGAMINPFLILYLKQRGLALSELSHIYTITPMVQLVGAILTGLIADKIGRSKPLLLSFLTLSVIFLLGTFLMPSLNRAKEDTKLKIRLMCDLHSDKVIGKANCGFNYSTFVANSCMQTSCEENTTLNINERVLLHDVSSELARLRNDTQIFDIRDNYNENIECFYKIDHVPSVNLTFTWCDLPEKRTCSIFCNIVEENSLFQRTSLLMMTSTFMILYLVTHSSAYRFVDVITICLVKDRDKDFGRERIWAMLGAVVFSPLSGYIVELMSSANEEEPRSYDIAFYAFWILSLMSFLCFWSLEAPIYSPGKNMWKKSLTLLSNPDVLSFIFILLVLGTSLEFCSIYQSWYLKDLHASSLLLGLLPAISHMAGLPFLHTSKWWVRKIGCPNIFILALVASMINTLGLSFIRNPWWALATELTYVLNYILLWVAVVVHCHSLAPEGLRATLISSAGGIHFGVGKGTASLIGGLTMDVYGGRIAFRIMACMCFTTAVLYAIYLFIRSRLKPQTIRGTDGLETIAYVDLKNSTSDEDNRVKPTEF